MTSKEALAIIQTEIENETAMKNCGKQGAGQDEWLTALKCAAEALLLNVALPPKEERLSRKCPHCGTSDIGYRSDEHCSYCGQYIKWE